MIKNSDRTGIRRVSPVQWFGFNSGSGYSVRVKIHFFFRFIQFWVVSKTGRVMGRVVSRMGWVTGWVVSRMGWVMGQVQVNFRFHRTWVA